MWYSTFIAGKKKNNKSWQSKGEEEIQKKLVYSNLPWYTEKLLNIWLCQSLGYRDCCFWCE